MNIGKWVKTPRQYFILGKEIRPKGKWVNHRCNVCNYLPYLEGEMYFNYCPYCGTRMEKNNGTNK